MNSNKGCHNCVHRYGLVRAFWKCSRTGFFTEIEMKFGGRCAGEREGQELRLWSPRPSLLERVINLVRTDRSSTRPPAIQDAQSKQEDA